MYYISLGDTLDKLYKQFNIMCNLQMFNYL